MSDETAGALMERVITVGDLSKLSPLERTRYYTAVCDSVGLNPLTKPLEYLQLNGKLVLYALRNATDQLRAIHKISVVDMTAVERDGVIIATCKVSNADGRTDVSKGAVTVTGLKGDALCNAIMKAETKAKRRATLSICGLSLLDETEIETVPSATPLLTGPISDAQAQSLLVQITNTGSELTKFLMLFGVEKITDLPLSKLAQAETMLAKKAVESAKAKAKEAAQ